VLVAEASAAAQTAAGPPAGDQPPLPVAFGADQLRFDPTSQEFDVSGNVRVDEPPFHLSSEALRLRRVPIGADVQGDGKLAFCPCLGTPLAVRFTGATVAPPHDLILRNPVLEVFGVPVAWLPAFWLRSPGRPGLLAPDLEWRGADGFFAGGGVHLPWRPGDTTRGLDLRAGGYVEGGVAVDAALTTSTSETRVTWDRLHAEDGIGVGARGATAIGRAIEDDTVAWDVDALRGARAVKATTDLDAAARPFDRAVAEASWRWEGWTFASGVRWVALRGANALEQGAAGPVVAVRRSDALGTVGSYDATIEGGQTGAPSGVGSLGAATGATAPLAAGPTTFVRAEGGATFAARLGSMGAALVVREAGVVSNAGSETGVDAAAQARASLGLPLVRAIASPDEGDPWVHRTEPRLEAALLGARVSDVFVWPAARGATVPAGGAWVAGARWDNTFGRVGSRTAFDLDAIAGLVGDAQGTSAALRARAAAAGPWVGLVADAARVFGGGAGSVGTTSAGEGVSGSGGVLVGRARIGPETGLNLTAHVAERDGVDPILARALVEAPLEPASGFLAATGWTGGGRVALPIGSRVTARGGADLDLVTRTLVAALGAVELHDPCNCVVVRATVAHRVGRDGIDAWLSVDLPLGGR
jgi:hypothetical protein